MITKSPEQSFCSGVFLWCNWFAGNLTQHIDNELGISYNFEYNGQKYFYRKNLQGDIIGIYDSCWNLLGLYEYDAWGNLLSQVGSEILNINPFRYRGYYYDAETGLYYLNSRYYDPVIGRFISPDSLKYLDPTYNNGLNLYAYCINDPVNMRDNAGFAPEHISNWAASMEYFAAMVVANLAGLARNAGRTDLFNVVGRGTASASKVLNAFGYAAVAIESIVSLSQAIASGVEPSRAISDTLVDASIGVGSILLTSALTGMLVGGSTVPVVGFVVGFLVGLGIGTLISIVDYWLPQVRQGIKDFVYGCYLTVIDIGNKIGYIFEDIWQSICNAFRG